MIQDLLVKRANAIMQEKRAFQPMPGGQPPQDPNAAPPMDPSMAGGAPGGMPPGGAPPMDPSMMGGAPGGGMPMDPSMMGGMMPPGMSMGGMGAPPPATVGQLSVTDFQTIMTDMLVSVLGQIMGGGAGGPPGAGMPPPGMPPEMAAQGDMKPISNTEISEKLDALAAMISGGAAPDAGGMPPEAAPPGPEMGFGGQAMAQPQMPAGGPGMEVQGSVKKKANLADMILSKVAKTRK